MNKKNILIGVSVLLLGVSGFLLYRSFFSAPATPPPTAVSGASASVGQGRAPRPILPYGNRLDFAPIRDFNAGHKKVFYPQVGSDEIGVTPRELIKF